MSRTLLAASATIFAAAGIFLLPTAWAQDQAEQRLGTVHFQTSCNDTAQRRFDRAMRYQHSFWYQASREIFEDVLKADPECGMAYWGIALSLLNNPHNAVPAPNLPRGLAAIQKAKEVGARTQRERDYIDALALMYIDYDRNDHRSRVQAYLKAMEALASRYPDDDETQIAYAITLNVAASPADKTYANQLKGAALLEPIFKRQPHHPGVAHYLIHLYDYPPIAHRGLDAAMRYSQIAPAAPHARHMPSHIFTRVGYWKESIAANIASVQAARADKSYGEQLHGWDYMVYAYLQLGQDRQARAVVDEMAQATNVNPDTLGGHFALAASPARYMVERGDWEGAARLEVRPTKFPQVEAITRFARALGAARSGNAPQAEAEIARLLELRDQLRTAKDAYWAQQTDIQRQVASAWLLRTQGRHDEALAAIHAAADAEDATEKSPVTPGPLAPARELEGAMLMELGRPEDALTAFEATLRKEPNRLDATIGAARASAGVANTARAEQRYREIIALTESADPVRPEIAEARAFLARQN